MILLDEIEKAHPDVFNILLQVLDDGIFTDNKGRTANFKNTIIIMTTNIGSAVIQQNLEHMEDWNEEQVLTETREQVFELLKQTLRPEFLNRIDETIMFKPLTKENLKHVVNIQFKMIQQRLLENGIKIEADDKVLKHLTAIGYDPQLGARPLKRILQRELLNTLSKEILAGKVQKDSIIGITLNEDDQIEFINLDHVSMN